MFAPHRQRMIDAAHRPAPVSITPRDLHFEVGGARSNNWLGGDAVGTAVFNAFSLIFPEGERLFMDAVRQYRAQLSGRLLEDAKAFISQEAVHSREHKSVNSLLDRRRYPVDAIEAEIREQMTRVRERGPMAMLTVTIALEHFTAVAADLLLDDQTLLTGAPRDIARLWQWHAVEEMEHKAVAFDVFAEATKDWPRHRARRMRNSVMRVVTLVFVSNITRFAARLLAADGMNPWTAQARVLWFMFAGPGPFRRAWRHYRDWYRADFHPSDHDDRRLLDRWRPEFPPGAAHGQLA